VFILANFRGLESGSGLEYNVFVGFFEHDVNNVVVVNPIGFASEGGRTQICTAFRK